MENTANTVSFRAATREDVPRIVQMLADDALGRTREEYREPLPRSYYEAFDAIASDANNELVVADVDGEAVGVMQLTFIPYLTHRGSWRALIEGVRVSSAVRGQGVGHSMIQHAIQRAIERHCSMVQLTTDKSRSDALRFYGSLGFKATHEGMKLHL